MKWCARCRETKPKDDFTRHPRNPDGLQAYCRMCCSEYKKERYQWDRRRQIEKAKKYSREHPPAPEYRAWSGMKRRCLNPRERRYADYGGRGITVCAKWKESYAAFIADMGQKPSARHSLDRINNDGNYEPANCKWSTAKEQANNRRSNI